MSVFGGAKFTTDAWALGGVKLAKLTESFISSFSSAPATAIAAIQQGVAQCSGPATWTLLSPALHYPGILEFKGQGSLAGSTYFDLQALVPGANGVVLEVEVDQLLVSGINPATQQDLEAAASAAIAAAK